MYILPDGTKELLEVTDRNVEMLEDIGLYLFDSGKDQIYFQMMLQSIHAIAQNAGEGVESLSAVLKSLTSANSVEEAHKVIQVEAERQRKMKEAIQKQQEQLQQQMKQQQMELAKYQAELELEGKLAQIKAQGEYNLQRSEIEVKKFAMQNDINENQINDGIEREKMKLESESIEKEKDRQIEREKLEIERRKILG
jgi:DNA-binding protein YbaB